MLHLLSLLMFTQNTAISGIVLDTKGNPIEAVLVTIKGTLKKNSFGMVVEVTDNVMTIPCSGLSAGTYAISMFQDENGNKSLDKGALGIPQEKYGFSNITKLYGPPSFDQSKFEFINDSTIIIDLQ